MKKTRKPYLRIVALLCACLLLTSLCACGKAALKNSEATTAATAIAAAPPPATIPPSTTAKLVPYQHNNPPSVMEPVQGGPMLYEFRGSKPYKIEVSEEYGEEFPVYPIGLINQDGELVAAPQYESMEYERENGYIVGVTAWKDGEAAYYTLDGKQQQQVPDDEIIGGHLKIIPAAEWDSETRAVCDSLFDTANNSDIFEQKDGQDLEWVGGNYVFGKQHRTSSSESKIMEQWYYNCKTGETKRFPGPIGMFQSYFPDVGWYEAWAEVGWDRRYYDSNLNRIPALDNWILHAFRDGPYSILEFREFPDHFCVYTTTLVNRKAEFVGKRYSSEDGMSIGSLGESCFLVKHEDDGILQLLDENLNIVCEPGENEKLRLFSVPAVGLFGQRVMLIDNAGNIKKIFDATGKELETAGFFHFWADHANGYMIQNGKLHELDTKPFIPPPKTNEYGYTGESFAEILMACREYLIVRTGVYFEASGEYFEEFAIDWNGSRISNCPLEPYFDKDNKDRFTRYANAGEQGPDYYWVEHKGKRGYINTKGEWLFADTTN